MHVAPKYHAGVRVRKTKKPLEHFSDRSESKKENDFSHLSESKKVVAIAEWNEQETPESVCAHVKINVKGCWHFSISAMDLWIDSINPKTCTRGTYSQKSEFNLKDQLLWQGSEGYLYEMEIIEEVCQ